MKELEPNNHPYNIVKIDNKECQIDSVLADLIVELNKVGLKTTQCCQEDPEGRASVSIKIDKDMDVAYRGDTGRFVIWWKRKNKEVKIVR